VFHDVLICELFIYERFVFTFTEQPARTVMACLPCRTDTV